MHGPTRCTEERRLAIPDASLSAAGWRARRVAGPHGELRRDECVGIVPPLGATTRDGGAANTPQRSRCCRGHIARRCAPAPHSSGSCRAGRSAPAATPSRPSPRHWTAPGRGGIKDLRNRLPRRTAPRARGSDANQNPGLRLFGFSRRQHTKERARPSLPSTGSSQAFASLQQCLTHSAAGRRQTRAAGLGIVEKQQRLDESPERALSRWRQSRTQRRGRSPDLRGF